MLERKWRAKVIAELKQNNAMVFSIIGGLTMRDGGGGYGQEPGWPDCYVQHTYWRGFIEFKGEKTKVTEKQKHIIKELNKRAKVSAVICRYNENESGVCNVEDSEGEILGNFTTAKELLAVLSKLSRS